MAQTYTENGGGAPDGSITTFTYSFETIEETNTTSQTNSEVKVALNGVTQNTNKYYVQKSTSSIQFHNTNGVDSTVQAASGAPLSGVKVRVYRDTKVTSPGDKRHTFQAGSAIKAKALNDMYEHTLFALDEEREQNIFSEDIEDGAVTRVKIAADAVDGTKIANDSLDSEHYVDGSVDLAHLSANSVDSSKIVDGSIVNADVNASAGIEISKLGDLNSSKILVGNGSNRPSPVDMSGDVTITNAGVTTIGADAVQIGNISDTETSLTANSDAKIPTSKAVADHVVNVVNSVGGFVIVADKDNFPASHPDPNSDAGTVLSITNPNGLTVSSNTSSNGTRTGGSSTVTINNIPASAGTPLSANYTMLVQTTSTEHTYDFYKFLAKDGDVLSLSNDINDFAARYKVSATAPITGLCDANGANTGDFPCDGDMYWNSTDNKMYVFGAPAESTSEAHLQEAWSQVTSTGEFKSLTVVPDGATSGSPVFGSNVSFDLRDGDAAASVTNRNQLIVVLNGVVQKSNAGSWSSSEEGFYLEGTDGIKFCTAPPSGSTIFVTLIGSAVSIPTPGDETVTEAKLNANAPTNDHVLTADSTTAGGFKWAEGVSEGTQVKSTGESTAGLYLGTDGDGTCSWQNNNSYSSDVTFNNDVYFATGTTDKNIHFETDGAGAGDLQFSDGVTCTFGDDADFWLKESSGAGYITAKTGGTIYLGAGGSNNIMNVNQTSVNIAGACNVSNGSDLTVTFGGNVIIEEHPSGTTGGSIQFRERNANGSAYVGIKGPLDMGSASSYTVTLPTATPTAGKALVANASTPTTLEWGEVSSTVADSCIYENDQTISNAYTIASGKGAHSVGPITLNNTVTVNGRWVIS